jgi:hypothetical protein
MAWDSYPRAIVQQAIAEGSSARNSLGIFRSLGGKIRTQTWERLYSQAQIEGLQASKELNADLGAIPSAADVQRTSSVRATGFMQRVVIMGRNSEGLVISKDVSIRTDVPVSRQEAIDRALSLVQSGMEDEETRDRYPMRALIGGFYQGTYSFEPGIEE